VAFTPTYQTGSYQPAPPAAPGPPDYALLNDEPVSSEELDLLGAGRAASELTRLLVGSRHATPFTLAVDAGWGMGKSSLMRLVDRQLQSYDDVHTVWYNAWTSTGADALEGLIKSVLAQVDPSILRRALRRVREGGALMKAARLLTLLAAGPLGVSGMVDELWKSLSVDATARNGMRDALRGLVGEWTSGGQGGAPGRLLVVFIDDLDRCSEETLLAVCEAVKVYLDVPGLAFVIGCDRAAMGPNGLLRDLSPAGAAFMEKIFQTSYRIPAASAPDIQEYVRACARHAGLEHLLDAPLVELLAYRAARNPRRVKRLVNGLLLEATLNPIWAHVRPEAVIRTLLLQYLYPDFYRMMTVPGGTGPEGDVVREFRTYRTVRGHLWSADPWPSPTAALIGGFLHTYGVPPLSAESGGRGRALTALERQLPVGFPLLADDPAFVSLLDELVSLEESEIVLRRLREGLDGPASSGSAPVRIITVGRPPDGVTGAGRGDRGSGSPAGSVVPSGGPPSDPRGGGAGEPAAAERDQAARREPAAAGAEQAVRPAGPSSPVSPALDFEPIGAAGGYRPTWYGSSPRTSQNPPPQERQVVVVGFRPENVGSLVEALRGSGIEPEQVFTDQAWEAALERGPRAVISHVSAFGVRGRGFALIGAARDQGYGVPVVFYTERLTPNDERAAAEVGAGITDDREFAIATVVEALAGAPVPIPLPDGSGSDGSESRRDRD
jgi:KAP family P-loop domain